MKALVTTGDGPLGVRLADVAAPQPSAGQAIVEVRAMAVNRGDLAVAGGLRPAASRLGWDVAGTVVQAAPEGSGPPVGTRVAGMAEWDGWAERVALRVDRMAALPDDVTEVAAAALPVAGLTAFYVLQAAGPLLGRTVLVTGASGGVGRILVQLAAAAGARVLALVGSVQRGAGVEALGADLVKTYNDALTDQVDVLVDSVGGDVLARAFLLVRSSGAVISYGNTTRSRLMLPADWGHARPGVRIQYLYLFDEIGRRSVDRDLALLVHLLAQGRLDPQVALTTSWNDPVPALRALQDRQINGKVVLTVPESSHSQA